MHARGIRFRAVVLLTGLAAVCLFDPVRLAAQDTAARPWLRLDTDSFIFFTNGPEDVARSTAYDLEELDGVVTRLWPASVIDSPVPTYLYVFDDDESFQPYRLTRVSPVEGPRVVGVGGSTAGYLVPHEHGSYAALVIASETRPVRFVYKQYVHRLLHDKLPQLPLWLRHGLAEYYSTFEIEDDQASIGLPVRQHLEHLAFSQPNAGLPLAELLQLEHLPRGGERASFFPRSWLLVHYLMTEPDLPSEPPDFVRRLLAGTPVVQALRDAYGFDLATLEEKLEGHLHRKEFRYRRFAVDRGAHPIRARPMARPEVLYRLGDLLLHNGRERYAEARELFESALELDPRHGLSWAGLGYLAQLEGDEAAALEHYRKAAERSGDSFLVHYLYGTCLVRSLDDRRPEDDDGRDRLDRALAALERATELQAGFAPSWAELGYAHNLRPEASVQAVGVLEKAADLMPARADVAFNLLLAYARVGDRQGAEAAVARIRRLGGDEGAVDRAAEILLQMDYGEAARLAREDRLDDAIAIFARVQVTSGDPALQQRAAEQLEKLEPKAQRDRFWDLYNETVRLMHADRFTEAAAAADRLREIAKPGLQQEEARNLAEVVERRAGARGSKPAT